MSMGAVLNKKERKKKNKLPKKRFHVQAKCKCRKNIRYLYCDLTNDLKRKNATIFISDSFNEHQNVTGSRQFIIEPHEVVNTNHVYLYRRQFQSLNQLRLTTTIYLPRFVARVWIVTLRGGGSSTLRVATRSCSCRAPPPMKQKAGHTGEEQSMCPTHSTRNEWAS